MDLCDIFVQVFIFIINIETVLITSRKTSEKNKSIRQCRNLGYNFSLYRLFKFAVFLIHFLPVRLTPYPTEFDHRDRDILHYTDMSTLYILNTSRDWGDGCIMNSLILGLFITVSYVLESFHWSIFHTIRRLLGRINCLKLSWPYFVSHAWDFLFQGKY